MVTGVQTDRQTDQQEGNADKLCLLLLLMRVVHFRFVNEEKDTVGKRAGKLAMRNCLGFSVYRSALAVRKLMRPRLKQILSNRCRCPNSTYTNRG